MKKVLWIACLLCMMPFLGYAQMHAGLASQDDEEVFGQAPVSKELPSTLQLSNITRTTRDGAAVWAHAMFVPSPGFVYGRYYEILENGQVIQKMRYNNWYYSAAEYFSEYEEVNGNWVALQGQFPVWAFAEDYVAGFMNVNYNTGDWIQGESIDLSMNDMTYDYNHGRMLGTKYGNIYEIVLEDGTPGDNSLLYDYHDNNNLKPIAIACDLDGTLYFVSASEDGTANSSLYKFASKADGSLGTPEPVGEGDLGWPARKIQTMAFNHKTRELFWWACDQDGNSQLFKLDQETAAKTEVITNLVNANGDEVSTMTTEISGLFFDFEYRPYTATCINEEGIMNVVIEAENETSMSSGQSGDFLPGETVEFYVKAPDCKSIDSIIVMNAEDHNDIITVFHIEDLVNNPHSLGNDYYGGTFVMPAHDVDIDATWIGNEHSITLTWTPTSLVDALTMTDTVALCGDEVVVTYDHPEGYYLQSVTAVTDGGEELDVTVNSDDSEVSFIMPDDHVTVTATYKVTTLTQIADICQYEHLKRVPNASHNLGLGHKHIYVFTDPNGVEYTYGDGNQSNNVVDAILAALTFDIPGVWSYTTLFVNSIYGAFPTATKYFTVHEAPQSIAITGEQYNCDSIGTIHLTVTATPSTHQLNGEFEWYKDGVVIATTTEPEYIKDNITTTDAGLYNVIYTPASSAEATTQVMSPCTFTLDNDYEVNVATLPNKPEIRFYGNGSNPICFESSVAIEWNNGVLNPSEYEKQWCIIEEDGTWTEIDGATNRVFETDILDETTTFGIRIKYLGDYNECYAESDPFVVEVGEEEYLEIAGSTETCQGFVPAENPYIAPYGDENSTEYTNIVWIFDGDTLAETDDTLHFENTELNGDLLDDPGTYTIDVYADGPNGCYMSGTMEFTVQGLPDITIANDITDDIAHYNQPVTITVCAGSSVQLTAAGGYTYEWSTNETTEVINIQPMESTTYTVIGTDEESGCKNTTTINVNVTPLPEITWITPSNDTTFSMMNTDSTDFQLEADPAGGIFTYVIDGDPNEVNYPIEDGLFNPAVVGIGNFQLIYSYQDANGCDAEEKIDITIEKPYWTDPDKWDSLWYHNCEAAGRFEITNPAQMGSFAAYVNGLNGVFDDFADDTIWITNNIDLLEKPYFYRPIDGFLGVLDGTGKVVTNMTILEDELSMELNGFIRNVGIKDANITSTFAPCEIIVNEIGKLHNSYVTMPNLDNVFPSFETAGEIRNVYYYGPIEEDTIAIYLESEYGIFNDTVTSEELLTYIGLDELGNPIYQGILEEWVWNMNDFSYRTWITDADPTDYQNYGYPMLNEAFEHHHYIYTELCDYGTDNLIGVDTRTIITPADTTEYVYAMNGDEITYEFVPESNYVRVDSITCVMEGYNGEMDSTFSVFANADNEYQFTFEMPMDSIYLEAYTLTITPSCRRDYWTDEGNYDPDWYNNCQGIYEISNNMELAALAYTCWQGIDNFEGDTIKITGGVEADGVDDGFEFVMDMAGHYWRPIYNFAGVINGTRYIVSNLFIREDTSAMFVDCSGSIINFGIKDTDLPEEGNIASYVYNDDQTNCSVINSFATSDPTKHLQQEIAVGAGVTVTNTYTLDSEGNMIDHNHEGIGFGDLRAWVANISATTPDIFWDWKLDEEPMMNYSYPIHSEIYNGGWAITYDPDILNPVNGYVSGPETAFPGDIVTVGSYPEWCFDMISLTVDMGDTILDISKTKQFEMPDHPVTVSAEFAPKNWTLTVNYVTEDGESIEEPLTLTNMHYEDEILISDIAVESEDYELVPDVNVDTVMPCGNMTLDLLYQGKPHSIEYCPNDSEYEITYTTDPAGQPRYGETVTLTVTVPEGVSIMGIEITDAEGNDVEYETVSYGTYTFVMPSSDIVICGHLDEEYWDDGLIADITWFRGKEDADIYVIETDSMLGGLAALVTGRPWLYEDSAYYTQEEVAGFTFEGKTIIIESSQEEGEINLIEHKWRPIGAQVEFMKQFEGYFDGNGHRITNMRTVDITNYNEEFNGSCQALFGTVGGHGVLNDVNIQGTAEGRYFTAGVAAVNYGIIMNCVADVEVRSEFQAGGIVCNNNGYLLNSYCISDHVECTSAAPAVKDGDVPTNNYYVGGVASFNSNTIINCHSVAQLVKGNGNNPINYYGGVVGMNAGEISECYWIVNPIEPGFGGEQGNSAAFTNCALISDNTSDLMTATAVALPETLDVEYTFYSWTDGEDGYPVFDLESRTIMNNAETEFNVVLYPNPTKGNVNIFSNNIQRVTVFNMFGQMVLDTKVNGNETVIDMSGFTSGVYMVRITTAEGTASRNVIVE